jgi:pimeloyl-ACP methyl ester carboxylesterase
LSREVHRQITRQFREKFEPSLGRGSTALLCSESPPQRAVVLVHGFGGRATATWHDLATLITGRDWWKDSDLFFIGYDSILESISGTASRLENFLRALLPHPPDDLLPPDGPSAAERRGGVYTQLVLVGHSQGGLIIRMAITQILWDVLRARREPDLVEQLVAQADVRLFAPAIFGARPAGLLGLAQSAAGARALFEIFTGASPSYKELQSKYGLTTHVQLRTERFADDNPDVKALTASIVWPANDRVVLDAGQYLCDPKCSRMTGGSHRSVCKSPPLQALEFIRQGVPNG